jgi:hypothetical protein
MHADFSTAAKSARAQIHVPAVDIEIIRNRSRRAGVGARLRAAAVSSAVALGILGTAAAFAANFLPGVHVWFIGNKAVATVQSFAVVRQPMARDVRRIVASAAFPVVLPANVPRGTRVFGMMYSPADRPEILTIQYRDASGKEILGVNIVDDAKVARDRALMPNGPAQGVVSTGGRIWHIGRETVSAKSRFLSAAQIDAVRTAMQSASPQQSLAQFEALLPRISVQSVPPAIADVAERHASAGNNVLLGKWEIHEIPKIAAKGKPLRDARTVYLTNIPQVHGQPDYRNATLFWPKSVAIPAEGVRVTAAVLQRWHIGPACGCAILLHWAGSGPYTLQKIDVKTLKVTSLHG